MSCGSSSNMYRCKQHTSASSQSSLGLSWHKGQSRVPEALHSPAELLLLYAYSWRHASRDAVSFRHMYQAEEVPICASICICKVAAAALSWLAEGLSFLYAWQGTQNKVCLGEICCTAHMPQWTGQAQAVSCSDESLGHFGDDVSPESSMGNHKIRAGGQLCTDH